VAEVKYKAALNVSAADVPLVGATPKLWVAVINSPMKLVVMLCVFAKIIPLKKKPFHRQQSWVFASTSHAQTGEPTHHPANTLST
jgi:hypothetical protein